MRPLLNTTVELGDNIVMEVELSQPDWSVIWKKNRGIIPVEPKRIRISMDGCLHRLEIDMAQVKDKAKYSLTAARDNITTNMVQVVGQCNLVQTLVFFK